MNKLRITDFDAIAFDLEGTLADTIPTHNSTRKQEFEQHGFGHVTDEQHALGSTYGSSHHDILGGVLYAAGIVDKTVPFHENQTVQEVITTKKNLFAAAAEDGFDAMPGAIEFVHKVARLFQGRMAIVTGSKL